MSITVSAAFASDDAHFRLHQASTDFLDRKLAIAYAEHVLPLLTSLFLDIDISSFKRVNAPAEESILFSRVLAPTRRISLFLDYFLNVIHTCHEMDSAGLLYELRRRLHVLGRCN